MDKTSTDFRTEVRKGLELLRQLRDEVRVQVHLGGMDAKKRWNELEPRLEAVEHAAQQASEVSRAALKDAVESLRELRDALKKS